MKKEIILMLGLLASAPSWAAGFDCARAATPIEQLICSDARLSGLDETLAQTYQRARTQAPHADALRADQKRWLTGVRDRCGDIACLDTAYADRIEALAALAEPHPTAQRDAVAAAADTVVPVKAAAPVPSRLAPEPAAGNAPGDARFGRLAVKFALLALALNALAAIYLHRRSVLTIYADYTDAAFTGLLPLLGAGIYFLALFLEAPATIARQAGIGVFAVLLCLLVRSTWLSNGRSPYFLMALVAKVTIVGLYYALMLLLLLLSNSSGRRKGERRSSYEARQRREARQAAAAMAGTTVGFVLLSAWLCRNAQFTPVGRYLSPRR